MRETTLMHSLEEKKATDTEMLEDDKLTAAIAEQKEIVSLAEQKFAQARDHRDQQRLRLRALEEEQKRRYEQTLGIVSSSVTEKPQRRVRSTTGIDAILGRDRIDPNLPLSSFRFLSLQRQEIVLNHTGDRSAQVLGFVHSETKELLEAHTFGEARVFYEQGHTLGRPGVPLQRQAIWYIAEAKPGWLRTDQLFVEHP